MFVHEIKGEHYGRVFWGGSDPTYYHPPMSYVRVLSKTYFNVSMDRIAVRGRGSFCEDNCFAIVDTGVSLIGGPTSIITKLNELLGAVPVQKNGLSVPFLF